MSDHYQWIHPPLRFVEEYSENKATEIVQDDINQVSLYIMPFDIPKEDRAMYSLENDSEDYFQHLQNKYDEGDEIEESEIHYGFWLSGDCETYRKGDNTLFNPQASDVFVALAGNSIYLPVGQHSSGSYHEGADYLISIQDYEQISSGIYTPKTYLCDLVRQYDPYKMIAQFS